MPGGEERSTGVSRDDVVRYIEEKIKRLKNELMMLNALLSILKGESSRASPTVRPESVEVITLDDEVIANVMEMEGSIRVILRESISKDHPLLESFLIRMLEERKESGDIRDYVIKESRGYVTEILLEGVSRQSVLKELELALKYVWREMHKE
ncbi:MAG: hypothetical protein DRO14_02840 [Thermoprotei archaeon]|nr:MAG: hypothetical protein DRO14_02840 [Thermoprotei archaeon]